MENQTNFFESQMVPKRYRLSLLHITFWCLYFSFFFFQISFSRRGVEIDYLKTFIDVFAQVLFLAAASYLNYFYFLPRFLKEHKVKYVLYFLVCFAGLMVILIMIKKMIYTDHRSSFFLSTTRFWVQHFIGALFVVIFVSMLRFVKDWFDFDSERRQIENEKLLSELRFLKEQINPHFLFNTLNNLYYLAHVQSPNTKEVILKLSQMMRYMIYEANAEKVAVAKEVEYIQNYIDLEKLRLEDNFPLSFSITGKYEHLHITPLIFITFLENAFKHGVSQSGEQGWVKVSLTFNQNQCIYEVSNSNTNGDAKIEKAGIGLKNTIRRLNLSYKNAHTLETNASEEAYEIRLTIEL